jgi:hypothetical protein
MPVIVKAEAKPRKQILGLNCFIEIRQRSRL